jgi:hypothetical protein
VFGGTLTLSRPVKAVLRLCEDRIAAYAHVAVRVHDFGVCVFSDIVARVNGLGLPQAVVLVLGELLRAAGLRLDEIAGRVVPEIVGQRVVGAACADRVASEKSCVPNGT